MDIEYVLLKTAESGWMMLVLDTILYPSSTQCYRIRWLLSFAWIFLCRRKNVVKTTMHQLWMINIFMIYFWLNITELVCTDKENSHYSTEYISYWDCKWHTVPSSIEIHSTDVMSFGCRHPFWFFADMTQRYR